MRITRSFLFISILTILFIALSIGQQSYAANNISATSQNAPAQTTANISFNVNATGTDINPLVLGTNLPAWLGPSRTENNTFLNRTKATGTTILRIPGGSWSNGIDWYACETGNQADCWFTNWGLRSSDFINFLRATDTEGMYTINMNGTSKEAAALVAFFNGSVSDNTVIGTDVNGRNWGEVSQWAQMRSDNGNPEPLYIKYWEIGNEIYGGKQGKDCAAWGWEDVWTCDGRQYVNGLGNNEGFIAYRNAMRAVDPSILVGAVGVPDPDGWSNWGNEVIEEAGDVMDFYIVHKYGFGYSESNMQTMLAEPQGSWQTIKADIDAAFDQYAGGRRIPIAVTEYNLFAVEGQDVNERMSQAVNGLYLADTIGQMMKHEFDIANQWDLAHGDNSIPSRYGLMRANNYFRSPQYYVFPMWSRFGSEMLPISSSHNAATELSVYAGRIDAWTVSVMAINKTGNQITTSIELNGAASSLPSGTADVVRATSLSSTSVTFNGSSNPNNSLTNAPPTELGVVANPMTYTFEPYSITLLRLVVDADPGITQLAPPFAGVNESSSDKVLIVNGYNFTASCVVRWNGTDLDTDYVSPTRLTAVIPAANISSIGSAPITVYCQDEDATSDPHTFTIVDEVRWVYLPGILK